MKRLFSILLCTFGILYMSTASVFALVDSTGPTMSSTESQEWINTYSTDARVDRILNGNYAFVADSCKYWTVDKISVADDECYIGDGNVFYIPSSVARSVFGVNTTGDYIDANKLASMTGNSLFFDPRGFALFGKTLPVMTTYNSNVGGYFDFYTVSDAIGKITWEQIEPTAEDYKEYIARWQKLLTVEDKSDESNKQYIANAIAAAYSIAEMVSDEEYRAFSDIKFEDVDPDSPTMSYNLQLAFQRIYTMAKGYYLQEEKDSELKEMILNCMEKSYSYYSVQLNSKVLQGSNWPGYHMDIPFKLGNTLCLLYDELDKEFIKKYTDAIFDRVPDSTTQRGSWAASWNITNRTWISLAYLNNAILVEDTYRINHALMYMNEPFTYSLYGYSGLDMPRDGIYKDGSVIFHKTLPYNLGYGIEYVRTVADFIMLTHDTPFDIRKVNNFDNFYQMLIDNFLPFFVDNVRAKIVCARYNAEDAPMHLAPILAISNYAPEGIKSKLVGAIKETIKGYETSYKKIGSTNSRIADYPAISDEVSKFWVYANRQKALQGGTVNRNFAAMDKMMHKQEGFTAMIGLSSNRTQAWEGFADAGQKDWYINNASCYVYNKDGKQFDLIWMNTANRLMMPGTTVDSAQRATFITSEGDPRTMNKESWAGGVSDKSSGVASMILGIPYGKDLYGKKSYFMFGDRIVCLGTDIFGGEGDIKTVIDNRLINKGSEKDLRNPSELEFVDASSSLNDSKENLKLMYNGDITDGLANSKIGSWIQFDLKEKTSIGGLAIAFSKGDQRKAMFDLQVSDDGVKFVDVGSYASSGRTLNYEFFDIPCEGKYIRLISRGNSSAYPEWFWIQEIRAYDSKVNKDELIKSFDVPLYGYDNIEVGGKIIEPTFNSPQNFSEKTAYLEGFGGYVVLDDNDLTINRDYLNGNTFAEFYINHGQADNKKEYAYVMLPGKSSEEVVAFEDNPNIEIISNTSELQAVKDQATGIIGASIYGKGEIEEFKFNHPCMALLNIKDGKLYVSDPTHMLNEVEIEIPEKYIVKSNKKLRSEKGKFFVDMSEHNGASIMIEFELKDENNPIKVYDYIIKMNGNNISTKLYAYAENSNLQYKIAEEPLYGNAYIIGDLLYYYADEETWTEEKIKIEVYDQKGINNYFDIILTK